MVGVDCRHREEPGVFDAEPRRTRSGQGERAMTFLTGKSLARRTVLKGIGASVSLPLLDAMLPVFSVRARAATPAHRFLAFYVPNGMAMQYWTPKGEEERGFELSPILEPLAAFRDQMLVL